MKKTTKIISVFIIVFTLMSTCFNIVNVYATQTTVPDVNYYKPNEADIPNEVTDVAGSIVSLLQVVGTIIAVITIMILGIKYMMGSVQERAEYKKSMIPYLVGCILLFATITIVNAVYHLLKPLQQ